MRKVSHFVEGVIDVGQAIRRAEQGDVEPVTPQQDIVRRHDEEHAWRARGEQAIRAEMERRIAQRRTK